MIRIHLQAHDLTHIRFGISPLAELVIGLRAALYGSTDPTSEPWRREARAALEGTDLSVFRALVRPTGYFPDFLTPPPVSGLPGFEAELFALECTPHEQVHHELALIQAESPQHFPEVLRAFRACPDDGLARLSDLLGACWIRVLAAPWPQVRALLEADIMPRASRLAMGQAGTALDDVHPLGQFQGGVLQLDRPVPAAPARAVLDITPSGGGLLLVPEVFCDQQLSLIHNCYTPTALCYQPRGVANLWGAPAVPPGQALALTLGAQRARVLLQLLEPNTTQQVARQLEITPGNVSHHVGRLRRAGLVNLKRAGRLVFYHLSERGRALLEVFE